MRRIALVPVALLLLPALSCGGGGPRISPSEVVVARAAALPADPGDAAWNGAPLHPAALVLQDMVDPRLLTASTTQVRVQALTDGARVAFRLEWDDATGDDEARPARFADACAVQLPAKLERDVPAPQMGESGRGVEISYWRASWQATVDGRKDDVATLYPNAAIGHYPFEAASLSPGSPERQAMELRYGPAHALGNPMAGPRSSPVEDLVAEGPGTTRPAPATRSQGRGERGPKGWRVVISRPLPDGLAPGARTQVAFAVWQGSQGEAGARKMRSPWVPLAVEGMR